MIIITHKWPFSIKKATKPEILWLIEYIKPSNQVFHC
jgi:hypothetical protein